MAIKSGGSSPARWEHSNVRLFGKEPPETELIASSLGMRCSSSDRYTLGTGNHGPLSSTSYYFHLFPRWLFMVMLDWLEGNLQTSHSIIWNPMLLDFLDYPWSKRSGNQQFSKLHWGPGRRPWCSSGPESLPHWRTRHGPPEYARCCQGYGQPSSAWGAAKSWKYQLIKWLNLVVDMILMIIYTYHS